MNIMRFSSSVAAVSLLCIASHSSMRAMEAPDFDFEGLGIIASELYDSAKAQTIAGTHYLASKSKEAFGAAQKVYQEQAPQVKEAAGALFKRAQDAVVMSAEPAYAVDNSSSLDAVPPIIEAGIIPVSEPILIIHTKDASWMAKTAKQATSGLLWVKSQAEAHPIITGVAITAAVVIPVMVYLIKTKKAKSKN